MGAGHDNVNSEPFWIKFIREPQTDYTLRGTFAHEFVLHLRPTGTN